MTNLRFGLAATFPGQTSGQPWDADWTGLSTAFDWTELILPLGNHSHSFTGGSPTASMQVTDQLAYIQVWTTFGGSGISPVFLVTTNLSTLASGSTVTEQEISLAYSAWNGIKDIEVSNLSVPALHVVDFVDTWINAPGNDDDHTILIDGVKRGAVALGSGNDSVVINVASNDYTWSNRFEINAGDGDDTIAVQPEAYTALATLRAPAGYVFNSAPQLTTVDITLGAGADTVTLNEVSGTIHLGSGVDTVHLIDGNSTIWLGAGSDAVTIAARDPSMPAQWAHDTQVGTTTVNFGSGSADVTIDDTTPALTPATTLNFIHGETGGSTLATADAVRLGHIDPASGNFVGGDLAKLTIDLFGYSAGSTATLARAAAGAPMLLQIHDAATGGVDAVALYGSVLTSAGSLNLHFI